MINSRAQLLREGLFGCDLAILSLSFVSAYLTRDIGYSSETYGGALFRLSSYAWMPWVVLPTWIFLHHRLGLYESASYKSLGAVLSRVIKVQFIGGLVFL